MFAATFAVNMQIKKSSKVNFTVHLQHKIKFEAIKFEADFSDYLQFFLQYMRILNFFHELLSFKYLSDEYAPDGILNINTKQHRIWVYVP